MALSKEQKEGLAEHFRGKDLYDPSTAPEQQVTDFSPCMCGGGCAPGMCQGGEMGYASGGTVGDDIDLGLGMPESPDFNGPALSADTATAHVPLGVPAEMPPAPGAQLNPTFSFAPAGQPAQPTARPALPRPSLLDSPEGAAGAPAALVDGSPVKSLRNDEYNQLLRYLQPSRARNIGNAAFSGLAGLADSIMTGVAKAPSSSFQKNLAEKDQAERKDLIDALRQKYETGFKGQELALRGKEIGQMGSHQKAEESQAMKNLAEEKRAHDLEAGQRGAQLGNEQNKLKVDAANKIIDAYEKGHWYGERPSKEEYNKAKNDIQGAGTSATVRIRDSHGDMHDLPAASLPAAKKRDPGLQVVP